MMDVRVSPIHSDMDTNHDSISDREKSMKTKTWAACLASVVLGFAFAGLSQPHLRGQDKAADPPQRKWEYKTETQRDTLNDLGKEGWELVAVVQTVRGSAGLGERLYFKRPIAGP
jgi:hypothetical protein